MYSININKDDTFSRYSHSEQKMNGRLVTSILTISLFQNNDVRERKKIGMFLSLTIGDTFRSVRKWSQRNDSRLSWHDFDLKNKGHEGKVTV
jgi:hypothetical protein